MVECVCEGEEMQLFNGAIYLRLFPVRVHAVDVELDEFDLATVCNRCQLYDSVQRHLQVRQLVGRLVEEVREHAAEHGLMRHDQHVALSLQLHHDRLEPHHHVLVGFAARVAISELVLVASLEVVGELPLDVFVRHFFTDSLRDRRGKENNLISLSSETNIYAIMKREGQGIKRH